EPIFRDIVGGYLQRSDHRRVDTARPERRAVSTARSGHAAAAQSPYLRAGRHHRALHRHQADRCRTGAGAPRLNVSGHDTMGTRRATIFSASIRPAVVLFLLLTVLTGFLYPLVVTGVARLLFPGKAAGSIVTRDGHAVGSRLIGQSFRDPKYFWSRPSATAPQPYNATASTGSN